MAINRKVSKEKGVYELFSETKTFKGKPDICFYIALKIDGKLSWEKIGWLSEGYSTKLASNIRSERLRSIRHGDELPKQKKRNVLTFEELAEKYLKWSSENKSRKGIDDKSRYENHLKARFDNKRLDEILPQTDLEAMKNEMSKMNFSPKTIAHCLALIRAMYNKASDWGLYQGANPVKKIKMPVIKNSRDRFLTIEEAKILLKELKRNHQYENEYRELKDPKLHDMALISMHTGARASEIFRLKGQDVDFQNGLITLRDTKNTETRYAPMTKDIREILKKRIPQNVNEYIFTDDNGQKIKEVSNTFERVVNRLGLNNGIIDRRQKVVFHTCRHSFASWLAIQGIPMYTISKLMGHKSIVMSERYSHLSPNHKKDAIIGLDKTFKKR